ncbi:MAG: amidohydrolase family protein [Acidimicrobiales bacterium]
MTSTIDLASIVAIDVHTHVGRSARAAPGSEPRSDDGRAMQEYFRSTTPQMSVPEMAHYYRERRMAAVVFTVDASSKTGRDPNVSNEEVAELAAEHPDVIIPFASIDPAKGKKGALEAGRLVEEYGVRGFKFHPPLQAFYPNDPVAYPLYEVIEGHRLPALFHTGHAGAGARTRGGGGIRLKYGNPMFVDDVAVDFPDMPIVLAHPSFPWQDEALSVAIHKPTVFIDLSGWSPKYFAPQLVQHANTILKDKMLFGSDFPLITPDRWMADFETIGIRDEVRPMILKENAARLLGLSGQGAG